MPWKAVYLAEPHTVLSSNAPECGESGAAVTVGGRVAFRTIRPRG